MPHQSEERNSESIKIPGEAIWNSPDFILSERYWKHYFDASSDYIAFINPDYKFVRVNQALADKIGLPVSSLEGASCCLTIHGTETPVLSCPLSLYRQGIFETRITEPVSPTLGNLRCKSIPLSSSEGELLGCFHIAKAIKQVTPATDSSNMDEFELIDALPFPAVVVDEDAVIRAGSASFTDLVSLEPGALLKGSSLFLFTGPYSTELTLLMQQSATGRGASEGEIRLSRRSLEPVTVRVSVKKVNTGRPVNPEYLIGFTVPAAGDSQHATSMLEHIRQRLLNKVLISLTGSEDDNCMKIISFLGEMTGASAVAFSFKGNDKRNVQAIWESPLFPGIPIDIALDAVKHEYQASQDSEVLIRMPELSVYLARAMEGLNREAVKRIAGVILTVEDKNPAYLALTFPDDQSFPVDDSELMRMIANVLLLEISRSYKKAVPFAEISPEVEELKKKVADLKEIDSGKDKLYRIVAHDLKNPFQGLLGFIDLLADEYDNLTASEIKGYIENIRKAGYQTYSLLDSLLEWSRIQTGLRLVKRSNFNLFKEVSSVFDQLESNALQKKIKLVSEVPQLIQVDADRNMIHSVLLNLIANAIKFTEPKGRVVVSVAKNQTIRNIVEQVPGALIEVQVADNGVGIPADVIPGLFKIDTAVSSNGTLNEPGTGLGLITSKEMVEMNGGTITVKSKEGEGSVFSFTLALA